MERHCALSRTLKPVDEMIRFVVGARGAGLMAEPVKMGAAR